MLPLLYCLLVQRLWTFHPENVNSTSPAAVSIDNDSTGRLITALKGQYIITSSLNMLSYELERYSKAVW